MNDATKTATVSREKNGQYAEGLDRVCRLCGHRKGEHDAIRPWGRDDEFSCDGFKAVRAAKVAK